jgi:polyhydroxyalkanoate synthesis repressor PhaR
MERIVKRYRNRKMYDTAQKEYVNFSDIERMIRNNEPVKVIDNVTGEDITRQTLVQLIMRSEPLTSDSRIPLDGLRDMVQRNENALFQGFRYVLNLGKGMVHQISSRTTVSESESNGSGFGESKGLEQVRLIIDKASESASHLIDGTLVREMLNVPKRDDMKRIDRKMTELEKRVSYLKTQATGGHDHGGKKVNKTARKRSKKDG